MSRSTHHEVEIDGRTLVLSNLEKILWPEDGYTKGELVAYYRAMAPAVLRHVAGRPLTLQRFPDGVTGESFYEKHVSKSAPAWIRTVEVAGAGSKGGSVRFIVCDDEATLAYVANLASIPLHVWTSRADALDVPEFVFFDLDPGEGCTLATLAKTALAMRDALAELGLETLVKTSGGSGLHIVVPLAPHYDYDTCRRFAELAARTVHARLPDRTSLERMIAKRGAATVYLDYVQVGRGKTLVAPYSLRPRALAPVSTPLQWSEVEPMARSRAADTERAFAKHTIRTAPARLAALGDLWGGEHWREQELEPAIARARTAWA